MPRYLIIEDESPAARRLAALLNKLRPDVELVGPCDTVTHAREVIAAGKRSGNTIDLLLCDIELADGLSFGIWDGLEVDCPVIFITAYDRYALRAFKVNSIDYLLKPIKEDALGEALNRFDTTAKDFIVPHGLITELREATSLRQPVYRTRLRVALGNDVRALPIDQVAHFYSEDRVTFALDHTGLRYPVSASIGKLTQELDPASWFRINRSQLVHISCVVRAGAYFNHRLKLTLKPAGGGEGVVARERVPAFNAWLGGEH